MKFIYATILVCVTSIAFGQDKKETLDYFIPYDAIKLIGHIKSRNSEVIICSGCLSGIVEKVYSKN
jgi:hypothetical protein